MQRAEQERKVAREREVYAAERKLREEAEVRRKAEQAQLELMLKQQQQQEAAAAALERQQARRGKGDKAGKRGGKGAKQVPTPKPAVVDDSPVDPLAWWEDQSLMGLFDLVQMGFNKADAEAALRETGDQDKALEVLLKKQKQQRWPPSPEP